MTCGASPHVVNRIKQLGDIMDYEKYLHTLHPRTVSHENVIDGIEYCKGVSDALTASTDPEFAANILYRFIKTDAKGAYVDAFLSIFDDDISPEEFWNTVYWYAECAIYAIEKDENIATEDEKDELFKAFSTMVYKSHTEAMIEALHILQDLVYKL